MSCPADDDAKDETRLYSSPGEALKKVSSEYEYWSGKLTESSVQMSYSLIAANWIVFGSVNGVLNSLGAKLSLLMVFIGLAANVIGAWLLSESLRKRVEYGESNSVRWKTEYTNSDNKRVAWPFTNFMELTGKWMRRVKAISILVSAICLIVASVLK